MASLQLIGTVILCRNLFLKFNIIVALVFQPCRLQGRLNMTRLLIETKQATLCYQMITCSQLLKFLICYIDRYVCICAQLCPTFCEPVNELSFPFPGIFPTQVSNLRLLCLLLQREILYHLATWEAPTDRYSAFIKYNENKSLRFRESQFLARSQSIGDGWCMVELGHELI